jgi:molybdate transport system substrate-binding protein
MILTREESYMRAALATVSLSLMVSAALAAESTPIRLYSAGSLRAAMTDIAAAYTSIYHVSVEPVYGASGALSDRLARGEAGDIFTSADMGYPEVLTQAGKSGPTVLFARNHLCAILRPGLKATSNTLLATLLNPAIKLGTSLPGNDPGGAYAWEMFKRADAARPGSRATLEGKALKIGNEPGMLAVPPNTRNAMVWLLQTQRLDIFLSYCTNGHAAEPDLPGLSTVTLPPELSVIANEGLTVIKGANEEQANQFALFILSPAGQKILADHGFDAPLQP